MKWTSLFCLIFAISVQAAELPKNTKSSTKSKLNTQIYEQENEETSFEAVVKAVREVQGETQVFFNGKQGFFVLSSENYQHLLVKSQKNKIPVRVQVNMSSRQILKVEQGGAETSQP